MILSFDAELSGADNAVTPVYCEVHIPDVSGQKSIVRVSVPAQHVSSSPPSNPCELSGTSGAYEVSMNELTWSRFPTFSESSFGLESIELLHIERLAIKRPPINANREISFHLSPISYLRTESNCVPFGDKSHKEDLFSLNLPDIGQVRFVAEWVTSYHRDAENLGATVTAGFSAVAILPADSLINADQVVSKFKSSLEVLSVLFRQTVTLHGWTYTESQTISTWISPLEFSLTPSAREDRGEFVTRPQDFVECAESLTRNYAKANMETQSLVRHLCVAINPHTNLRVDDHFLSMFSALEKTIGSTFKLDKTPKSTPVINQALIEHLIQLQNSVTAEHGENAEEISARLGELIKRENQPSVKEKFEAFLRVYPMMTQYCDDIWPILQPGKNYGLKDIRDGLAHGRGSLFSRDVLLVADWHLAILIERIIFVLLEVPLAKGISPKSTLLQLSGKGWYEKSCWMPLQSKPTQPTE